MSKVSLVVIAFIATTALGAILGVAFGLHGGWVAWLGLLGGFAGLVAALGGIPMAAVSEHFLRLRQDSVRTISTACAAAVGAAAATGLLMVTTPMTLTGRIVVPTVAFVIFGVAGFLMRPTLSRLR